MAFPYRYILQRYTGRASRYTCPGCKQRREFTLYLDTRTLELLPEQYGKCNRAAKCTYYLSPYHTQRSGQSYARQMYEEGRANAWKSPANRPLPPSSLASRQTTISSPAPVVDIPVEVMQATLGHYQHNALARLLNAQFGAEIARKLLLQFHLGTSAYWPGACVFWLIDEQKRVRGGQVVLLDETGHTVKRSKKLITWVHEALVARTRRERQLFPAWLTNYLAKEVPKSPCLFGLPQLANAPANQPVAIVESAKTAILCAAYMPVFVWLATMGMSYLNFERLAPLKGRQLVFFPDVGALNDWQRRAEQLRAQGFTIIVSTWLEEGYANEPNLDLADVLLREWAGYPPSWNIKEE